MARRSRPEDLAVARLPGAAKRHARSETLDAEAAVRELQQIPAATPERMAEAAGLTLGFYRSEMDFESSVLEAALVIAAGADLTRLRHWIRVGQQRRAERPHFNPG